MMIRQLAFVILSAGVLGCHSNPYSGDEGKLSPDPVQKKPVATSFPIQAQAVVDVTEGATVGVNVVGRVTSGAAEWSFEGLPSFATFANGVITLAPPVGAATDPAFKNGEYKFNLILFSSDNPDLKTSKDMTVVVHPASLSLTISQFTAQMQLREGVPYSATLQISSSDMPISVSGVDLPAGMSISSTPNSNQFNLTYTPSFTTAKYGNSRQCTDSAGNASLCRELNWTLTVVDGKGAAQSIPATWTVYDVRQAPLVKLTTLPDIMNPNSGSTRNPLTGTFYIEVQDPNGEVQPSIEVVNQPSDGYVDVSLAAGNNTFTGTDLPYVVDRVAWTQIPSTYVFMTRTIQISSCVYDVYGSYSTCQTTPVDFNF